MRKLFLLIAIVLAAYGGFSQATPSNQIRIADTSTVFGLNLAKGTTVYTVLEKMYFAVTTAVPSTATYHTARTSFTQIGGTGLGGKVLEVTGSGAISSSGGTSPNITVATATETALGVAKFFEDDFNVAGGQVKIDYTGGQTANGTTKGFVTSGDWTTFNNKVTSVSGSGAISSSGGETPSISIANAAADGATKGAASFTANDFDASSGNVSIDYTNGQAASTTNKGFLTSTDWNTFSGKQTATLTSGNILVGNGSNVATSVTMSGDARIVAGGALTIQNSAVTLAKQADVATGTIMGRTTTGTGVQEALTVAQVKTMLSQKIATTFTVEAATDALTTPWTTCTLSGTPTALTVLLNGMNLRLTTQYTTSTNTVVIIVPVYQYDKIEIIYSY